MRIAILGIQASKNENGQFWTYEVLHSHRRNADVSNKECLNNVFNEEMFDQCDDVTVTDSESKSLIFIAGYVAFKLIRLKVNCDMCKSELITDHSVVGCTDRSL